MYSIEIKRKAKKEMQALTKKDQQRVFAAFNVLRENPFIGKKLEGKYEGARSLRVWPYRIIYTVYQEIVTVTVLRVAHRQGVYH